MASCFTLARRIRRGRWAAWSKSGRKIDQHLRNAIELGRLCSNDPVCAQHSAKQLLEERFLLGAACHGCLLISETSCERFNQYLDRSLVVATVGAAGAEFFTDQDLALP
jgi:hypothetical protein